MPLSLLASSLETLNHWAPLYFSSNDTSKKSGVLNYHVKSENKSMCCGMFIILVIWKLATLKLFSLLQPKHRQLYSSAHVDIVMRETDFI